MKQTIYIALLLITSISISQSKKGFDLSNSSIPVNEIKDGGPPKDGIPSIDNPVFISANDAGLNKKARVLGVFENGIPKAYPINILNYHEIVNDEFKGKSVVVSYCPLCGSGLAFEATIDGKTYEFGVSGLLYNSDVLLYDRQTESLWSQLENEAISGPMKGEKLKFLNTANTTWASWKARHPETLVLSEETGFIRDYSTNPYPNYNQSESIFFPVSDQNNKYHPKETIIGLELDGKFKAYPFSELKEMKQNKIKDVFRDKELVIEYDQKSNSAEIYDIDGKQIPAATTFWFAWYAFHPETEIFKTD